MEERASLVEMSKGAADEDSITELLRKCELRHKMNCSKGRDNYVIKGSLLQAILRTQLS